MDIARFKAKPILGILRGIKQEQLQPLLEAIEASGLESIEITMNTPAAADLIRKAVKISGARLMIGAGTVLSLDDLKSAWDSGASFMVTPVFIKEVAEYCVKNTIPFFPGALTPLEIYNAWNEGATMVKVFPAKIFGPDYFKEIRGPFRDIKLLACAGVTPENLRDYFSNGASAVSFGASVFRPDWIENMEYNKITLAIKRYVEILPLCKKE